MHMPARLLTLSPVTVNKLQPPPLKEGLQLNARPSKRHQQHHKQELSPAQHSATTVSAAQPQPQQQQQQSAAEPQQQQQQPQKGGFQQTVLSGDNQAVKVSLNDCLACSGCVTSAETVLLQAQSLKEFMARCEDPDAVVVVSLSAQSRASLAGEALPVGAGLGRVGGAVGCSGGVLTIGIKVYL
jgi:hypothetical protein